MKKNTILVILVLIVIGFVFYRSTGSSFGSINCTLSIINKTNGYLFIEGYQQGYPSISSPSYKINIPNNSQFQLVYDTTGNLACFVVINSYSQSVTYYFPKNKMPAGFPIDNLLQFNYYGTPKNVFNIGYMNQVMNITNIIPSISPNGTLVANLNTMDYGYLNLSGVSNGVYSATFKGKINTVKPIKLL